MLELPRFFLHFLNSEILGIYRGAQSPDSKYVFISARRLTRTALLFTDHPVIVPPAALFERDFADRFLDWILPASRLGLVEYASPTQDLGQFAIKKQREYRDHDSLFARYAISNTTTQNRHLDSLTWLPRIQKSASVEITKEWDLQLNKDAGVLHRIVESRVRRFHSTTHFESELAAIPTSLGGRAFITQNVAGLLSEELTNKEGTSLGLMISGAYIMSFLEEFGAAILIDTPLGKLDCGLPETDAKGSRVLFSYRRIREILHMLGLAAPLDAMDSLGQLIELRTDPIFQWLRALVLEALDSSPSRLIWALTISKYTPQAEKVGASVRTTRALLHQIYDQISPFIGHNKDDLTENILQLRKAKVFMNVGEQLELGLEHDPNYSEMDTRRSSASIGVITALEKEYAAMKLMIDDPIEWVAPGTGAGRRYLFGSIPTGSGYKHGISLALMTDTGNNSAAVRATQLLAHCPHVKHIIMCGIAGGIPTPKTPAEFVHLGDVVVSDQFGVIQYDFVKDDPPRFTVRARPRPPSAELLEAVRYLRVEELQFVRRWEPYLSRADRLMNGERPDDNLDARGQTITYPPDSSRRAGFPKLFIGPIASSNTLLKNPERRDQLYEDFRVLAVEMESSGIADAVWISGRAGYLTIRGICDYCDPSKGDLWQGYAAVSAASCTRAIIEMIAPSE